MQLSDPLGDMLTRIRNGLKARLATVKTPASGLRASVLEVLKREGYIRDYQRVEVRAGVTEFEIALKYFEGQPAIKKVERISTPGRRVYSGIKTLPKYYNGLGISILSTPKGVLSDHEARAANVGGEVLARVF